MNKPLVSVIIRAFNSARYISQCIESILNQTFQTFEVIIVDDASTDGTGAILRAYAQQDERIRVIKNKANQGPVRTMNIGLRQVRGEFIAVLDADDLSLPHRLETQVNFLKSNSDIALVGGGAYFVDEEGMLLRTGTVKQMAGEEVRRFLAGGDTFIHSSLMYRRECIEAIGLYDEFFLYTDDYDMLIRMAAEFDLVYYEEPLVKWRKLNSGITGQNKMAQAAFAELARIRSRAKKEGRVVDLQEKFSELMSNGETAEGVMLKQSVSDAQYYYQIGVQLLEQKNCTTARKRFWQALKHRGSLNITLRILVFYVLSFWPAGITFKPIQVLRKTF